MAKQVYNAPVKLRNGDPNAPKFDSLVRVGHPGQVRAQSELLLRRFGLDSVSTFQEPDGAYLAFETLQAGNSSATERISRATNIGPITSRAYRVFRLDYLRVTDMFDAAR